MGVEAEQREKLERLARYVNRPWAENAEIIEVLRGLGVDYSQGYGVSQPQRVQRAAIA